MRTPRPRITIKNLFPDPDGEHVTIELSSGKTVVLTASYLASKRDPRAIPRGGYPTRRLY